MMKRGQAHGATAPMQIAPDRLEAPTMNHNVLKALEPRLAGIQLLLDVTPETVDDCVAFCRARDDIAGSVLWSVIGSRPHNIKAMSELVVATRLSGQLKHYKYYTREADFAAAFQMERPDIKVNPRFERCA
jgi:hypothetical protein